MSTPRRGLGSIRTMGALVDNRRARTPAGALIEMSAMANEKQLLHRELGRWKRRHAEIQARLAEIAAKERRLMAAVQVEGMTVGVAPEVEPFPADGLGMPRQAGVAAFSTPASDLAASRRFKVQELSY